MKEIQLTMPLDYYVRKWVGTGFMIVRKNLQTHSVKLRRIFVKDEIVVLYLCQKTTKTGERMKKVWKSKAYKNTKVDYVKSQVVPFR